MLTSRERLVRGYMYSIYIDGARTFATTNTSFHQEIKTCAAGLLTLEQIDAAKDAGRITDQEHADTVALIGTPEAEAWKTK